LSSSSSQQLKLRGARNKSKKRLPESTSEGESKKRSGGGGGGGLHPLLKKLFYNKFRRTGVALTASQLVDAARQRRLPVPSLVEAYKFLREDVAELAGFAGGASKPKSGHHQTVGVSKPGVFFVDYGEFNKQWRGSNSGCTGFLVAVENLTNRLFAEPTRGKDTAQWKTAIAKFLEKTDGVKLVYSDRDSVAQSATFRSDLQSKYNIKWNFLAKDNKSYLAETYINYLKRKLGQALRSRGAGAKRWIDFLPAICETYNNQRVPRTKFRRGGINQANFDSFVGQLFGESDPSLSRYNSFKAGPFDNEKWNKAVFKFDVGEKVLLVRSAIWKKEALDEAGEKKRTVFTKASWEGGFSRRAFTVAGRQLRANRNYSRYIPVYSLAELGARHFNFYEPQMRKTGAWAQSRDDDNNSRGQATALQDAGSE